MPPYMLTLTWVLALAGAAAAVGAAVGKGVGVLSPVWSGRLYVLSYLLMGLSVLLFVVRGLIR